MRLKGTPSSPPACLPPQPQRRALAAEARASASAASAARLHALLELEDAASEKRKALLRDRKGWTEQHEAESRRRAAELSARAEALEAVRRPLSPRSLRAARRPDEDTHPLARLSAEQGNCPATAQECREAQEAVRNDPELLAAYPELGVPVE